MSRKKESVDGSSEELTRRKLKAIRQCLKTLEEDLTEQSHRRSDLCHTLNDTGVKEISDGVKNEETDFSGSSSTETKMDVKLGLSGSSSEDLARPSSSNTEDKNVQCLISSNSGLDCKPGGAPSADMENKALEGIDEALWIGICNLSHLQDADEMLKCFELQVKQEGDKVAETADRKFDELVTSLLSRKRKLHAELVKSINNYSADVAKAKQLIEEKKKGLIGAIRIARELKITPSVRTYCDLDQVIHDLKLPVDAELSRVSSLKEKTSPRFLLNTEEITSFLKNLGKIEWGASG